MKKYQGNQGTSGKLKEISKKSRNIREIKKHQGNQEISGNLWHIRDIREYQETRGDYNR